MNTFAFLLIWEKGCPVGIMFVVIAKTSRMKLRTVVAAILLVTGLTAQAQSEQSREPLRLGVSIMPGVSLNNPSNFVLGADLRLQQSIGNSVSWILTSGYTHFFWDGGHTGYIPVKGGLKVFATPALYFAGEAGAGFGTQSGTGTSFVYSPSIGTIVARDWDISVKYEDFTKYSATKQLALRVAYGFKL